VAPPAAATPAPTSPVHLVLIPANSRSSWVELRLRSSSGPLVYKGVVPPSGVQFSGGRIWARFGAAANLSVTVNGHRVPLSGTLEHVFGR
jgi:hypothetical protein